MSTNVTNTRETDCVDPAGLRVAARTRVLLKAAILVALVLLAATILAASGRRSLLAGDETRYGTIIHEMAETRSFMVLTLNGVPYSHKPPLHFWTIYLLTRVFGLASIWPYLIPSLVAFASLLWFVYRMMQRICAAGGLLAVFIYATFYVTWGAGQIARMDAGFAMFITAAVLYLWWFLDDARPRHLLLAGVATGLAILTKGPMALVIIVTLIVAERLRRGSLPRGPYLRATLLALSGIGAWLGAAAAFGGGAYVHDLVITQNIGRAVDSFAHREPVWFYLLHAPAILFPWFFLFAIAVVNVVRKDRMSGASGFLVNWILAVLIPFSFVSGKLEIYMLPAFVPVSLLVAAFLAREEERSWRNSAVVANLMVLGVLLTILVAALIVDPETISAETTRELLRLPIVRSVVATSVAVLAAAVTVVLLLGRRGFAIGAVATGFAAMFPLAVASALLTPVLGGIATTEPIVAELASHKLPPSAVTAVDTPYLWTRDTRVAPWTHVNYVAEEELDAKAPPRIILTRSKETLERDAFAALLRARYRLADVIDMRGRPYYVFLRID
ncbi:MAG: ArnT family glycosyltransferase [Thermoanaerobaculia bacterium]